MTPDPTDPMPELTPASPSDGVRAALRWLVAATVALYLVVGGLAWQNTRAICALRSDVEVRVASSEKYLREHPEGFPGLSPQTIRDGIANQKRTIKALGRNIFC